MVTGKTLITLVLFTLSVSACRDHVAEVGVVPSVSSGSATSEEVPGSGESVSAGWHRVGLGNVRVTALEEDSFGSLLVRGLEDGRPFVARVDRYGQVTVGADIGGDGADLAMIASTGGDRWAVLQESERDPPVLLRGELDDDFDPRELVFTPEVLPEDSQGRRPLGLWVATADEDLLLVGAFDDGSGQVVVHPVSASERRWLTEPPDVYLADGADGTQSRVTGTEASVAVIGAVTDDPGRDRAGIQLWSTPIDRQAWQRIPLQPEPDLVTDVHNWALGFWIAASVGGRPVVYDMDGRSLEVPDADLDREHPAVFIADPPVDGPPVLALQTADGPVLFEGTDQGWQRIDLPTGRMTGARKTGGAATGQGRLFVLVDEQLWWRPAESLWQ